MLVNNLTQKRLKKLLRYDPRTGDFIWLVRSANRIKIGDIAGSLHSEGYINIRIENSLYFAHRLAFLYMTGKWPVCEIDHINHINADNRFLNLREVNRVGNLRNQRLRSDNTSGVVGVNWYGSRDKWHAYIGVKGKTIRLGYFENKNKAIIVRKEAEKQYNFHPNHGK